MSKDVVTLIAAVLGTGAVSALIAAMFARRRTQSESGNLDANSAKTMVDAAVKMVQLVQVQADSSAAAAKLAAATATITASAAADAAAAALVLSGERLAALQSEIVGLQTEISALKGQIIALRAEIAILSYPNGGTTPPL